MGYHICVTSTPPARDMSEALGDFTTTPRTLLISAIALGLGFVSAYLALALLTLIQRCTNLFFFQRWSGLPASPAANTLGPWAIAVPVAGALLIGVMARYGSERIRGHGIPEAIEAILIKGSRVDPRVALLKPLSSAISIGSGGPFGAEGPIILTGGAFGSLVAQLVHLTSAERKTLLVAGAAAGMSATFAAPLSAILLAVELLLFEWKPRSLIPVAVASVTAAIARRRLMGVGPLFPVPPHPAVIGLSGLGGCLIAGLIAAGVSALLTLAVYAAEDAFERLPIHWMWWPAVGGVVVGVGGYFFPPALGVGYDVIGDLLGGVATPHLILGVLVVKSIIWATALGSGTSGGVLAPLLMIGGAVGGLEAWVLPWEGAGFWPLISMGAILGGTMRSPLTGVLFAVELTHQFDMVLPLLVAVTVAHGCSVLLLRRSILTEKVARRGYHLSREYAVDPLEILFVREVMRTSVVAIPADASPALLHQSLHGPHAHDRQRLYPVVGPSNDLVGVVPRDALQALADRPPGGPPANVMDIAAIDPAVAYPDESLRMIVYRMAQTGLTRFPVIDRQRRLVGMIGLQDLLKGRALTLEAEQRRERVLGTRIAVLFGRRREPSAV